VLSQEQVCQSKSSKIANVVLKISFGLIVIWFFIFLQLQVVLAIWLAAQRYEPVPDIDVSGA